MKILILRLKFSMREKRGHVAAMRKLARGKLKMQEPPTECGSANNYDLVTLKCSDINLQQTSLTLIVICF